MAIPASGRVDLSALLQEHKWHKGVSFVISGSMRATPINGAMEMRAGWRADIIEPGKRKALLTLVTSDGQSVADLFTQLADLVVRGPLEITR